MSALFLTLVLAQQPAEAPDAGPVTVRWLGPGPQAQTTQSSTRVFFELLAPGEFTLARGPVPVPCRVEARDGRRIAHCTVTLDVGNNPLVARLSGTELRGQVTRIDTTGVQQPGITDGFGPQPLHRTDVEATCASCHPALAQPPTDQGCAGCHPLAARPKVHGPVAQGNCLVCHATPAESRFGVKWPIQETCFTCHLDIKGAMWRKAFRHGPAAAGRCTTCHDPHGSDQPYWIKKPAFALCTSCHTEKATERHVVVGFVYGDSHPLQGRPHPLKPNTEFACPACHNPHAAQARFLWQFDATKREVLCRTCHDK